MKRFVILFLSLVFLISVFAVPAFAATTADSQATSLQSGWTSSYAPSGYTSSWFWRIVSEVDSIASDVASMEIDVSSIGTNVSTISTKITALSSNITDIKTSVGQINTSMTTVKNAVDSVKSAVIDLKSTVTGLEGDIGLIETWTKNTSSHTQAILTNTSNMSLNSNSISSDVSSIKTSVSGLDDDIASIKTSNLHLADSALALHIDTWATDSTYDNSWYRAVESDTTFLVDLATALKSNTWMTSSDFNYSWYRLLFNQVNQVSNNTNKLVSVYATEDDIALKQSQAPNDDAILSGVGSVNRSADISSLSGLEGDIKSFFAMGDVDIGLMFGQVQSGYSNWFSMMTARSLAVGGGASAISGASAATYGLDRDVHEEPDTPYLDAYAEEVERILAGGDVE